jgi:hypothetical protein
MMRRHRKVEVNMSGKRTTQKCKGEERKVKVGGTQGFGS